jgi:hypothetical protein
MRKGEEEEQKKIGALPHEVGSITVRPDPFASVRPEPFGYAQDRLRGAESKGSSPARIALFDFAAGAATLRANGLCLLNMCHTVPMFCGST